jgi:hypothetical protein
MCQPPPVSPSPQRVGMGADTPARPGGSKSERPSALNTRVLTRMVSGIARNAPAAPSSQVQKRTDKKLSNEDLHQMADVPWPNHVIDDTRVRAGRPAWAEPQVSGGAYQRTPDIQPRPRDCRSRENRMNVIPGVDPTSGVCARATVLETVPATGGNESDTGPAPRDLPMSLSEARSG